MGANPSASRMGANPSVMPAQAGISTKQDSRRREDDTTEKPIMDVNFSEQEHEKLWMEWQYSLMLCLGEHLQNSGIKYHTAREVMESFFFDFAMIHDQNGIEVGGETYLPRIGFVKNNSVITSKVESHMHEAVHGLIDDAYED
ncbi:MAG: hypothetical protein AAF557_09935 [Pseudomonadota bacterium]